MKEQIEIGSIWKDAAGELFRVTGVSNETTPWVTLRRISDGVAFTKSSDMIERSLTKTAQ